MRPGILHLDNRMQAERQQESLDLPLVTSAVAEPDAAPAVAANCELDEPRWAVISFEQIETGGLTYSQATALTDELDAHKVAGLCIVTDEAAARMRS